jgi:LPS O-antigen subunit length determinant protein (WzzB/FepE family)
MSINKEINPMASILFLWRNRILISFFSILGMSVFLLISINFKKDFTSTVTINDPPNNIFEPYNSIFYRAQNETFRVNNNNNNIQQIGKSYLQTQFVLSFHYNIKSIYNFRSFINNNNNNYDKSYKINNINFEKYFNKSNFGSIKNKEKNNNLFKYSFVFPEDFPGDIFFKEYIQFTKKKTMLEFETDIKETISNSINYDKQILNIVKQIDYSSVVDFKKNNNFNEYLVKQSFNELNAQVELNKILLQDLNFKKFDHNPFLEELSKPIVLHKYYNFLYSLLGLSFGFFSSLIVIYFRNLKVVALKNK